MESPVIDIEYQGKEELQPFLQSEEAQKPRSHRQKISASDRILFIATHVSRSCLSHLLPSFLLEQTDTSKKPNSPRHAASQTSLRLNTGWLDGLRGWASLIVFNYHFTYVFYKWTSYAYGGTEDHNHILTLPIIRLFWSGPPVVSIFFVVSGYSLSWSPLKDLMFNERTNTEEGKRKCLNRLASGTFRRYLRLFLPVGVVTLVTALCMYLGLYTAGDDSSLGWAYLGQMEGRPPIKNSLHEQLTDWQHAMIGFCDIFLGDVGYVVFPPDVHLWTIPAEFRFSLFLFLLIAALTRVRLSMRYVVLIGSVIYCYVMDGWMMLLFVGGLLLAQIQLHLSMLENGNVPLLGSPAPESSGKSWRKSGARAILFVASLYLLSTPELNIGEAPSYNFLWHHLTPPHWGRDRGRFPHVVGSILIVSVIGNSHSLQSFFSNNVSRYLGRISYALYLVHGPVLHMFGYVVVPAMWKITGGPSQATGPDGSKPALDQPYEGGTAFGKHAGFILGGALIFTVAIWVADLVCREIDERIVRFAKWIEAKMS